MRKRITSLLLTLAMLLSLVPAMGVTASAAEPEWTTVNSYEELQTAINNKKEYIKLGRNIDTKDFHYSGGGLDIDDWLTFEGQTCTLDLNGKTLSLLTKMKNMPTFMRVYKGSNLTIKDSYGGGQITGEFKNTGASDSCLIHMNQSSLTLEGGTFRATAEPYGTNVNVIEYLESNVTIKDGVTISQPEHSNTSASNLLGYGYTLREQERKYNYGDEVSHVVIDGGTFDGCVQLIGYPDTNGSIQINGGTFKKDVKLLYIEKKNNSNPAVAVNGGTFEGNVYLKGWYWKDHLYMPYRLNGGTFNGMVDLYADWTIYEREEPEGNPNIALGLDQCFGYSAVVTEKGAFASNHIKNAILIKHDKTEQTTQATYELLLQSSASKPVRIIRNAWGVMESVTLDGLEINYAKDWKGGFEEMDNSTAHTLKFTWKPLASELVNAGYSYRAECDRYISGKKTPTTDPISATANEYSFTIPAGADPKVYSFDLHLNLKKGDNNIGIISNEHIVKLVVNPAPVVVPDPTLTGKVYYTSGIVYGRSISTGTGNLPTGFDSSKLRYQWQRSTNGGSTWTNIEGETRGSYTPVEADMGENVRIRVKITANGYLGEIVGAAVKVSKAANDNTPAPPAVAAQKDDSGVYKKFVISDFNSDKQEYVYTDSPASGSGWPSGTPISSATVEELDTGSTYYIYTRFKETDTHTAGSKISSSSVLLDDETKLNRIILTDESSGKVYGSYGNGNTIYIKKGESVTLTATKNPDGANKWSAFTFKSQYNASAPFTVTAPTAPVASGAEIPSVTIHGNEVGTGTLAAEYSGYPAAQSYGTWRVHVYENVSDIGTDAEITVSPSFPDMTMYQGETMPLPEYTVDVYPEGALENYDLAWRIVNYGPSYKTSDDNITLKDGEIEATKAHTGSKNTRIALVAINKDNNNYISSLSDFYVTVTKALPVELTGLTVAPTKVNLDIGDTITLSAVKQPVNADGILSWASDKPRVATVDNTGKVIAQATQGTATITVSCGDKKATCTVTVHTHDTEAQPWVYMDPGTHTKTCTAGDNFKAEAHTFSAWKKVDDTNHNRTCTACKMTDGSVYTETASHNWQWVVDTHATSTTAGKKHEECSDCHARRNEGTVIPATGGGSSSGGGSSGGGGAGVTTYAITVQNSKNGAVTASHKSAAKDTAVTLTVTPDKGYVLDTLNVLDSKNKAVKLTEKNGKYTFTMPAGKVTVSAAFKAAAPASENPFTDVPSGAYYEDAVIWAVKKDITSGTSATTFDPDGSCTRAQAVTFLWRAAGSPEPKSAAMPFTDVPAGSYFEKAVLWAVENGITKGTSDTTFDPDASCTRAQIVTFLWRAGGSPAVSGNSAFSDVAADAYYAAAVAWAEKNGVTGGIGGGLFGSDNTCTRAQIVTFLHRAMK